MNFEKDIFKRTKLNTEALISYGFIKNDGCYKYSKVLMDNFRVGIVISEEGIVTGKVYDISMEDEYTSFRIKNQTGSFVNKVRDEYKIILEDIKSHCFESIYFITDQANRITKKIIEKYHDEPEFVWDKSPGFGVFRNPENKKWYGLIMNIDKSKIDKNSSGEIEAINVKLGDKEIPEVLKKKGFYPAYHMNKKHWVTIILDDTLKDEEIIECISTSYKFTESKSK